MNKLETSTNFVIYMVSIIEIDFYVYLLKKKYSFQD